MRAGRIRVTYASHSPQVEAARDELVAALAGIEPRPGEIPIYSTVTGEPADTAEMDPEHWFRQPAPARCCSSRQSSDSCGKGGGPSSRSAPIRC